MSELFEASLLFSDQQLCFADILSPSQVRARIEVAVINFLNVLNSENPKITDIPLINRNSKNSKVSRSLMSDDSKIYLSNSCSKRSLMNENAAKGFVRVWKVMEMCYQVLMEEKRVTQRELFYKLLCTSSEYFSSQEQVNRTIQDVVALLRCSRYSLGIMASTRGLIAGRILLQEQNREVVDCSVCGSSGHPITGDLSILESLIMKTDARYIIVIEKHAIFQRLTEDRFFNQVPSILITAKGYPDLATRFLLHKITKAFPNIPILALVDWNPAGLGILCTLKYGSIGMGLEAYKYGWLQLRLVHIYGIFSTLIGIFGLACNVRWLGVRGDDLQLIPEESMAPLKPKDLQIAKSLESLKILSDDYQEELTQMVQSGHRAEIEALYCHGYDFLGKYLAKKIVQADYI